MSYAKRIQIYENWKKGCYQEIAFFHRNSWFPAHLILDKEYLYTSRGGQFRAHRRISNQFIDKVPKWSVGEIKDSEILSVAKHGNTLFIGKSSGQCIVITNNSNETQKLHNKNIDSVDLYNDIFVTATESCTKIWRRETELGISLLEQIHNLDQSFYNVKIDPDGKRFVGGKFRDNNYNALRLIDLET